MLKYIVIALLLVCAIVATRMVRDPYNTHLPLDKAEMSALQEPLAALSPDDNRLVLAYMERSNGDRLPASLADPDEPFTASTFREAIVLQKAFEAKYPNVE